ncbi:MAG: IS1595 family transposase [Telmatospirillum sp.]|nr:IS1595 family transposase [Telmatospirillum sp.]
MSDFPRSLLEFQRRFPDDAACARYLAVVRWPDGFICPECGGVRGCLLTTKAHTFQCYDCHRQTSMTAGTIMHKTHLPLTAWFWAAYLMATHSNGISARQLWKQLGLGSYKSAWLLCAKLRRAMVDPNRDPLSGLVEADETQISYRTKDDPPAGGGGRSGEGKLQVAAAVEIQGKGPGRVRLAVIENASASSLRTFLKASVAPGTTLKTDGWSGYIGTPDLTHEPHVVGPMAAHIVLPWVHRIFSNLKTWALGVYHGLRKSHLQAYLDEFVFRFNRRRTPHAAFRSLLGIGVAVKPATYKMLIDAGVRG